MSSCRTVIEKLEASKVQTKVIESVNIDSRGLISIRVTVGTNGYAYDHMTREEFKEMFGFYVSNEE